MLPDLRFAVSAVLASTLLIVTAFGLAATVRVAQQRAASPDDTLRMLVYTDPVDWGRFFVEQRPIAAVRADAPAVGGAVRERAVVVTPDPNAATPIVLDRPIASIVTPETNAAPIVMPSSAAAPIAMSEAKAAQAVATDRPAAAMVAPDANAATPVVADTSTVLAAAPNRNLTATVVPDTIPATASDARAATAIAPNASAAAVVVPDIDPVANDICACEIREHESIDAVKPVEEGKVVDPVEQVAVSDPLADGADLTTSSVRTTPPHPSDAKSPGGTFEPALEPSERVIGLPAFPNAGPGFVPPHDIALPVPQPKSRPAAKPKKRKAARRRVRTRPPVEPPLATTGYPVLGFDKPWSVE
jgi:hypothetical protein